jgi:glycyl-tRNA synthetase beta chain
VTWAAVSLADKLDTVVGMFFAGERPTGSRDPLGLRRQAQGAVKTLADLPELTDVFERLNLGALLNKAAAPWELSPESQQALDVFMRERVLFLFEQRGYDIRNVRAVTSRSLNDLDVAAAKRKLEALVHMSGSEALLGVATLLKRAKNITKGVDQVMLLESLRRHLTHPSEERLAEDLAARAPAIRAAAARSDYRDAFTQVSQLQPAVAKFFDDVLVMAEDEAVRAARLGLVAELRDLILSLADISEIAGAAAPQD